MVEVAQSVSGDGEIFSAGCDWLTMTYKADEYEVFMVAMKGVAIMMGMEEMQGHEIKAAKLRDYEGTRCGQVFAGARADSYIIEGTGTAGDYIARHCISNGCEGKATRLDLQASILYNRDREGLARETHERIRALKTAQAWPSQMGLSLYEGGGRGDSLYIGSRSSDTYRRLYDKTRESRFVLPRWLWRWEIEYKQARARQVMVTLLVAGNTSIPAQNLIGTEWKRLGLEEDWMSRVNHQELAPLQTPTDDETRLRWLERNVRATVDKLRRRGRGDDAIDALGLSL